MIFFKVTRADGTDFRTGRFSYIPTGKPLVDPAAMDLPKIGKVYDSCGTGLHLSPTAKIAATFANRDYRGWRYFECEVDPDDIIAEDESGRKIRARKVTPLREVPSTTSIGDCARGGLEAPPMRACVRVSRRCRMAVDLDALDNLHAAATGGARRCALSRCR